LLAEHDQILSISIYWETNDIPTVPFGKRATMFSGRAPLKDIFEEEVSWKHVKKLRVDVDWDAKTLAEREIESGRPAPTRRRGKMLVPGKILH
jgi:hypothetical protein